MEINMTTKKEKNYSTARIYIEDLARLRLIAKHTGKTQISTLHDLVKEKWNDDFMEEEDVTVSASGIESVMPQPSL
jgi:hypothetical protein|tara:strand:+ start:805 stop:1032 length:228 start_codon:yes stop_codon:yes gene_type:complete